LDERQLTSENFEQAAAVLKEQARLVSLLCKVIALHSTFSK
jgi:hypothetical protein